MMRRLVGHIAEDCNDTYAGIAVGTPLKDFIEDCMDHVDYQLKNGMMPEVEWWYR